MTLMHDSAQQEQLYIAYHPKVLRYIQSRVSNHSDAEDLAATVFLKVFSKLAEFDVQKASLSTWIFTITRNTVIDYFRQARVGVALPENEAAPDDLEGTVLREELLELLAKALENMERRQREIIILHYYRGKTLGEIAAQMDISYSYVKVLHKKAVAQLKTALS